MATTMLADDDNNDVDGDGATGNDDDGNGAAGDGMTGYNDDDNGNWRRRQ